MKKPFKKGMGSSIAPYYKTAVAYVGPGDIVSGASAWVSPARAYSAAFAAGGTAIMDLLDQAGANPITISILSTGFANLAAIAAWVTANSVSTIKVTKLYDQTGNTKHFTNATLGTMPVLTLSALNGLPGITSLNASGTVLTSPALTITDLTMVAVFARTGNLAAINSFLANQNVATFIGSGATGNTSAMDNGTTVVTQAATDSVFHSVIGVLSSVGGASAMNTDGTEITAQSPGTSGFSAPNNARLCRSNTASSVSGTIMEAGIWPALFTTGAGQTSLMNANMHGSNGYNF